VCHQKIVTCHICIVYFTSNRIMFLKFIVVKNIISLYKNNVYWIINNIKRFKDCVNVNRWFSSQRFGLKFKSSIFSSKKYRDYFFRTLKSNRTHTILMLIYFTELLLWSLYLFWSICMFSTLCSKMYNCTYNIVQCANRGM